MELLDERELDLAAISRLPLFCGISVAELEQLASMLDFRVERYNQGELILGRGQPIHKLWLVAVGTVCADLNRLEHLESNDMGRFEAGRVLGLETVFSSIATSPSDLTVTSPFCKLVSFDYSPLLDKRCSAQISQRFIENWLSLLSDQMIRMIYWTQVLSQRSLRNKIMTFFRIMTLKSGRDSFIMNMSQSEFAS